MNSLSVQPARPALQQAASSSAGCHQQSLAAAHPAAPKATYPAAPTEEQIRNRLVQALDQLPQNVKDANVARGGNTEANDLAELEAYCRPAGLPARLQTLHPQIHDQRP